MVSISFLQSCNNSAPPKQVSMFVHVVTFCNLVSPNTTPYLTLTLLAGFQWQRSQSHKSTFDLVKIGIWSRKQSHKFVEIGVRRIRTVPFSSGNSSYDPMKTRLSELEAEAQEPTNNNVSSQAF